MVEGYGVQSLIGVNFHLNQIIVTRTYFEFRTQPENVAYLVYLVFFLEFVAQ